MTECGSQSGRTPREKLAQLETLFDGIYVNSASELPSELVGAANEELRTLPSFAVLSTHEDRLWQTFLSYDPPSANYPDGGEFFILGWLTTTFYQAHAAFRLAAEGLGETAVANIRAAMEHAIYLSAFVNPWDFEIMLNSIELRHLKGLKRVRDFIHGRDLPAVAELIEIPTSFMPAGDDQKPTGSWPEKIEQVCHRLNTGPVIYLEYRNLSAQLHPGISSALLPAIHDHPGVDDPGLAHLDSSNAASLNIRHSFWLAIGACAWAGWAADQFFGTAHFGPLLAEFTDELDFVPIFNTPQLEEEL